MESWLSGRKQQFTKLPNFKRFQGFESLTLRSEYRLSVDPKAYICSLGIYVSSNPLAFSAKGFELHSKSDLYHDVPFHSQFSDITPLEWRKVGCGIASVAMLIDFYSAEVVSVDTLLTQGIASNAYLSDAGWTHNGLINLSKQFGLDGASYSLSHLTMESAFVELERVVKEGPVMVSVHYTFKPTNPIPHLAVVTGIDNDRVYYNDPAEAVGQNSISIQQFQSAWKKRYIEIRPAA